MYAEECAVSPCCGLPKKKKKRSRGCCCFRFFPFFSSPSFITPAHQHTHKWPTLLKERESSRHWLPSALLAEMHQGNNEQPLWLGWCAQSRTCQTPNTHLLPCDARCYHAMDEQNGDNTRGNNIQGKAMSTGIVKKSLLISISPFLFVQTCCSFQEARGQEA